MGNENIGQELLKYAKEDGLTVRGALLDLFPYIYAVSDRMSTRKVSEWLEQKHDVKISYSALAKALQKADGYIQETVSKFYGDAAVLDYYIPSGMSYTGLDVLASRSLCNFLRIEDPLHDSSGFAKDVLNGLEGSWFALPEKYRDACMVVMREQHKQERKQENEEGD
ncbi:MAG: hypothetical protein KAU94_03585 [Verrucomicrobia bacterium]|nr:hypothetical protein [Verrucomicrobiota bacterium]